MDFPYVSTKVEGITQEFDLSSPTGRHEYFHAKAGKEIEDLKEYLDKASFVSFWLAKKQAGKGTYTKMFTELVGEDRVKHISVGDIVRHVHEALENPQEKDALYAYLQSHYRGPLTIEQAFDALLNRTTQTLLPSEFILSLVKREVEQLNGEAILMDGFPRGLDQISYSLYFREIMNLRNDPDFFVLIDVPNSVLDARMKNRVICPLCHTSRSPRLFTTKSVGYDKEKNEFYLLCDNSSCEGFDKERLVAKEGDELGIEGIRERLEGDENLIKHTALLQGVDKIKLRNTIPVDKSEELVDHYEVTPEYIYTYNEKTGEVTTSTKPWIIEDHDGTPSYSLLAPAVVLSFIKQLHKLLIE